MIIDPAKITPETKTKLSTIVHEVNQAFDTCVTAERMSELRPYDTDLPATAEDQEHAMLDAARQYLAALQATKPEMLTAEWADQIDIIQHRINAGLSHLSAD